jgi:WD40 repeat protein
MDIFAPLLKSVGEHLGAAQLRLVRHVLAVGQRIDRSTEVIIAARADVLAALAAEEGKAVADDALRQRIKQVNRALEDMAGEGQPLFELTSAAPNLVVTFAEGELDRLLRQPFVDLARESTNRDVAMAKPSLMQEARVLRAPAEWQVFVSYGWESKSIDRVVKQFVDELERQLGQLPHQWRRFGKINLFFDKNSMHKRDEFQSQARAACERSQVALFMLSDKFHNSPNCQDEVKHFWPEFKSIPNKAICILVSGDLAGCPENFKSIPSLAEGDSTFSGFKNLIDFWPNAKVAKRDAFVKHIRQQICEALIAQYPDGPQPQLRLGQRLQTRGEFDQFVLEGRTEEPHVVSYEDQDKGEALLPILEAWARTTEPAARIFALLGSFGAGKTTAVQLFAQRLDEAYAKDPTAPFPVYLDFRRLLPAYGESNGQPPSLAEVIRASLNAEVARDLDIDEMMRVLRREPCVIIFDGLDEIGTRKGVEWATTLYRQLMEIVPAEARQADRKRRGADWSVCPTRILITCRTQFFRDHMQEQVTFNAFDRGDALPARRGEARIETRYMAPFTPEQIKSFFVKTLEEEGERLWASLSRVGDLADLAKKPIMTRYIAEIGQDLEADLNAGRRINVATVYDHLFNRVITRDAEKKTRMTANDRRHILRALALHLWWLEVPGLSIDALEDWFDDFATHRSGLAAQYTREDGRALLLLELRNASLLMREEGKTFRFVHTSFYEYFLASALLDALVTGGFTTLSIGAAPSPETVSFVVDIIETDGKAKPASEALAAVFRSSASVALRQLAARIMNEANGRGLGFRLPAHADCSGLDLREMDLNALFGGLADQIDFTNAQWNGARLIRQRFHACQFEATILANASFDACSFDACLGTPIGVASAAALEGEVGFLKERGLVLGLARGGGTVRPVVLCEPMEAVYAVAFSPDGAILATGSDDGSARLFSVATGREVGRFEGLGDLVNSIAFSPDGTMLATGSGDGIARLFSVTTGREVRRFEEHEWVTCVAFSPDGAILATGSGDGIARLISVATGREVGRFNANGGLVSSVAFSPDGAMLAMGSNDGVVRLFAIATGRETSRFWGNGGPIACFAFSPDVAMLATGSHDGVARLYSVVTGREAGRFEGHSGSISCVAFSPDGATLATGSRDHIVRLFSVDTCRELDRFGGHLDVVASIVFSPDASAIVTGSFDGTAMMFSIATAREVCRFKGEGSPAKSVAFAPNGAKFAVGLFHGTTHLFSVPSGVEMHRFKRNGSTIQCIAFSPESKILAVGFSHGSVQLFSVAMGHQLRLLEGPFGLVTSIAFSPDGATLAVAYYDNTVRLFSVATGREIDRYEIAGDGISSVVFSADGALLAVGLLDCNARLFSVATGQDVFRFKADDVSVTSVAFSPHGATLAIGLGDGTACLISVATVREMSRFEALGTVVESVAFSPDGATLATGSDDRTARLFSIATGQEIFRFSQHRNSVTSVAFSPDGTLLATGCRDGATRLFDVKTGWCVQTRYAIGDGWVMTDEDGHVIRMTRNAFPYIHGLLPQENGLPRVVAPALPEIVDDI